MRCAADGTPGASAVLMASCAMSPPRELHDACSAPKLCRHPEARPARPSLPRAAPHLQHAHVQHVRVKLRLRLEVLQRRVVQREHVRDVAHLRVLWQHQRHVVQHPPDLVGRRPARQRHHSSKRQAMWCVVTHRRLHQRPAGLLSCQQVVLLLTCRPVAQLLSALCHSVHAVSLNCVLVGAGGRAALRDYRAEPPDVQAPAAPTCCNRRSTRCC